MAATLADTEFDASLESPQRRTTNQNAHGPYRGSNVAVKRNPHGKHTSGALRKGVRAVGLGVAPTTPQSRKTWLLGPRPPGGTQGDSCERHFCAARGWISLNPP